MPLTPEQLELRRTGISSSDVPAILGLSRFRNAHDVWMDKMSMTEDKPPNADQYFGHFIEGALLDWYEGQTGVEVYRPPGTMRGREPWMLCTPDGLIAETRRNVEAKSVHWTQIGAWGDEGTDEIPMDYVAQTTWQMMCLDYEDTHFPVLLDRKPALYLYTRDKNLEQQILERISEWRRKHILGETPPDPDGSPSSERLLNLIHRPPERRERHYLESDSSVDEMIARYNTLNADALRASVILESMKQRLMTVIGTADGIDSPEGKVQWHTRKPTSRVKWKEVARELKPSKELIEKHTTTTTPNRLFEVKEAR